MISIVIPFYNEEVMTYQMVNAVYDVLMEIGEPFEILAIDDGSDDATLQQLVKIKDQLKELKIVSFSRNFGLQAALTAGLEYAKGDYIVLIDGDLQDPPELIADMYSILKTGKHDVVIGKRETRNEKKEKRLAIQLFHTIFKRLSGLEDIYQTGNFCMMKRNVVNAILQVHEKIRYLPGLRSFVGFRRTYINYNRPERIAGEPKQSFKKLLSLAADAIFSFSKWPIKACLWLGLLGIFLLLLAGIYTIISKAANWAPLGWSSTILSIYFIGTIQLTFLGVIGEYLYRIYKEVQRRPIFIVREHIE